MYKIASNYTSAIYWISPRERKINNGSIFFLDCGSGPFAVTADHVYQGYLDSRDRDSKTKCQIGNLPFSPIERLIDRDKELDIATFTIDEKEIEVDKKTVHRADFTKWPPKPPDVEKGIFFAGYPGSNRTIEAKNGITVNFGTYFSILVATSVNDKYIACHYERDEIISMFDDSVLPAHQNLGGLSGAPLWTLVQTSIFSWRLGGIIYQFNPEFELLYARRPDSLLTDGRINKT